MVAFVMLDWVGMVGGGVAAAGGGGGGVGGGASGGGFESLGAALAMGIGLVVGFLVGVVVWRWLLGHTLASARSEAERLRESAEASARAASKEAELEAQRRTMADREAFEQEMRDGREEIRQAERRIAKREDQIDFRLESLDRKETQLEQRSSKLERQEKKLEEREKELAEAEEERQRELSRVSGLSVSEAKAELLASLEDAARDEGARSSRKIIEDAEGEAKEKAREITLQAVQRYAGQLVAESTSRVIEIPSDDLKGRIIGREGRNIRAIEKYAGVDLIVDDTPGVIMVSCFDKVRQAIAVEALEALVADGRIHPGKIEEAIEAKRAEIEERIRKEGQEAALEAKVKGLSGPVREAMGKLSFRTSHGQNVLKHSVEVAYLSQLIADQLGLDGRLARRCGFLHDIGKAMDHEMEGGHPKIGMDFARQHGEKEPVLNAIGGHHGDIPSTSFYTPIVMAADALSGARPGARRESLQTYIKRLTQLQEIARDFEGVREAHAVQAGREVRVMVDAGRVDDDRAHGIARRIAERVSNEMTFPGEIKVTVLRESRAIEIAR